MTASEKKWITYARVRAAVVVTFQWGQTTEQNKSREGPVTMWKNWVFGRVPLTRARAATFVCVGASESSAICVFVNWLPVRARLCVFEAYSYFFYKSVMLRDSWQLFPVHILGSLLCGFGFGVMTECPSWSHSAALGFQQPGHHVPQTWRTNTIFHRAPCVQG